MVEGVTAKGFPPKTTKSASIPGLISPFIDTAFNGNLFMWDSAFNVMYGRYFSHVANFQTTLDNFYACQHKDGFYMGCPGEEVYGDRFRRDVAHFCKPLHIPGQSGRVAGDVVSSFAVMKRIGIFALKERTFSANANPSIFGIMTSLIIIW